jgi:prolyl oligopeptidase
VRDVERGRDLPDTLRWIKFSGASWTDDGKGFFYSRYAEPAAGEALTGVNRHQKLYYHRLGTPQSADELIYERPDEPEWGFGASVTDDGRYAVVTVSQGTDERNRLYVIDLGAPRRPRVTAPVVKVFDRFDASYDYVATSGRPSTSARTTAPPVAASWRSTSTTCASATGAPWSPRGPTRSRGRRWWGARSWRRT